MNSRVAARTVSSGLAPGNPGGQPQEVSLPLDSLNGRRFRPSRQGKTQKRSRGTSPGFPAAHHADRSGCEPDSLHAVLIKIRSFAVAEPRTSDGPEDYVSDLRAELECWSEGGEKKPVGRIRGYIVEVERALRAGVPVYDLYDMHSGELSAFWAPLYSAGGKLTREVRRLLGGTPRNRNVLVLAGSEIEPGHRGRKLGLYAVGQIIDHLKLLCGIAICQPFPMQFGPAGEDAAWMDKFGPGLDGDLQAGLGKLRSYWTQLGFRRIPGSDFFALNTQGVQLAKDNAAESLV